jgi:hypothetical protein
MFQQYLTNDDHILDPRSVPLHVYPTIWEVKHGLAQLGYNGVGVDDGDVGGRPWGEQTTVMEPMPQGGLARQPLDCLFQGHDWPGRAPYPVPPEPCPTPSARRRWRPQPGPPGEAPEQDASVARLNN